MFPLSPISPKSIEYVFLQPGIGLERAEFIDMPEAPIAILPTASENRQGMVTCL
jgi:hypothetical protein